MFRESPNGSRAQRRAQRARWSEVLGGTPSEAVLLAACLEGAKKGTGQFAIRSPLLCAQASLDDVCDM